MLLTASILVLSCEKERRKCPPSPSALDGRDKFVGQYQVFDTTGTYLYAMEIFKSSNSDSLWVMNWGGKFNTYVAHDNNDFSDFFNFSVYHPALDHDGHRWSLSGEYDEQFESNYLVNDTLRMSYSVNNIAFYVDDGVPFFSWSYREYGVKQ